MTLYIQNLNAIYKLLTNAIYRLSIIYLSNMIN